MQLRLFIAFINIYHPLAPQLGIKGPINGKRVMIIINNYLLTIFKIYLKKKPIKLNQNPNLNQKIKSMNPKKETLNENK